MLIPAVSQGQSALARAALASQASSTQRPGARPQATWPAWPVPEEACSTIPSGAMVLTTCPPLKRTLDSCTLRELLRLAAPAPSSTTCIVTRSSCSSSRAGRGARSRSSRVRVCGEEGHSSVGSRTDVQLTRHSRRQRATSGRAHSRTTWTLAADIGTPRRPHQSSTPPPRTPGPTMASRGPTDGT